MIRLPILSIFLLATIAACTTATPPPEPGAQVVTAEPRDQLPAQVGLQEVRDELLATAADRYGQARLGEALAAKSFVIAKRFAGMLPPPPPGETAEYVPPAALLMKGPAGWMKATENGWSPLQADQAEELNLVVGNPAFWTEAPNTPACPDYGASLLLLKAEGKAETVRNSRCTSLADKAVFAALNG